VPSNNIKNCASNFQAVKMNVIFTVGDCSENVLRVATGELLLRVNYFELASKFQRCNVQKQRRYNYSIACEQRTKSDV